MKLTISSLIIIFIVTNIEAQDLQNNTNWTRSVIWYQIFSERFYNGNQENDPRAIDIIENDFKIPSTWKIHPWNSDWYKLQSWEKENNLPFYWIVSQRRYGGDLEGVIAKLDYLQDLGITGIYLNPIFESQSHHKYNAAMYHHVDNNFGKNPNADKLIWESENPEDESTWKWTSADSVFLRLIKECHKRNIKIIIDGVFNHVGKNFWAFEDVKKNQEKSKYKDWFNIISFDDSSTDKNEFDYKGWYGIKDLPEFWENENGFKSEVKQHIYKIVKRWMDPNNDGNPEDGIDGWRLDVAEMVSLNFWKEFRSWVKKINPNAYISGEIWWQDWQKNKMFNAKKWLDGNSFDGVMNYRFARAVKEFFVNDTLKISSFAFADSINKIISDYGFETSLSLQNLLDSHDVDRIASQLNNPDIWYDHNGNIAQNANYNIENIDEIKKARLKLIVALQMTMPGAPMIYYGDEAGMWGGDDPDCRKPMVWNEFVYEDEVNHPFGKNRKTSIVKFDIELFDWYKKMISIRKANPELISGKIKFIKSQSDILVFERFTDSSKIFIFMNNQNEIIKINLNDYVRMQNKKFSDLLTNKKNIDKIELLPFSAAILKESK